jgi:mRNA interferase RelE/StbE
LVWRIDWELRTSRELLKLDKQTQREIIQYLDERVASIKDPRAIGAPLAGTLTGFWRYRVRDYRIICKIVDEQITIMVMRVGHRRQIYK